MEYGTQESCFVLPHSLLWAKASSEPHFISLSFHGNQTYFMNSQKITLSQTMGLFPEQMKSRGFSSLANGKGTLSDYPASAPLLLQVEGGLCDCIPTVTAPPPHKAASRSCAQSPAHLG